MGTHDLDTIKGPFTYEALKPEDIKFTPLNQQKEMNGKELMEFYEVELFQTSETRPNLTGSRTTKTWAAIFTSSEILLYTLWSWMPIVMCALYHQS